MLLLVATGLSQAQMGPGGGGGGAGKGSGPSSSGKQAAPTSGRTLALDDMLPPDPWRIWHERLQKDAPSFGLNQEQLQPFNDFVRELGEASQLKGIRTLRSMRGTPFAVSAVPDVARDFRMATDDARGWLEALQDLESRWRTLRAALSPEQQAQLDASYAASRETARTHPMGGQADGQSSSRGPPR